MQLSLGGPKADDSVGGSWVLLSSWLQLEMGQELQAILACSRGQRGGGGAQVGSHMYG